MHQKKIILTSASPRRKALLEQAELDFEIMVGHADEDYPADLPLEAVPVYIARNKALAVAAMLFSSENERPGAPAAAGGKDDPGVASAVPLRESSILVAADTIVVLDGEVIGKPADKAEAITSLHRLSGRVHQVITGVVMLHGDQEQAFSDITEVEFYPLTDAQIRFYVDRYAPYDKAGAYAIQEWIGAVGIKAIRGDFYNVMGLPVSRVVRALREMGA